MKSLLLTIASEIACAGLLALVLLIIGLPLAEHLRWFAVAFVPPLLLLRHYAKDRQHPQSLKGSIIAFFVTFVAFMWVMIRYRYITFQ